MKRLSVLMAVAFVDMIGLMMIVPLLPLYAVKLHATASVVGLLSASFPVAQLASSPVWGRVSDRYGRRPALVIGLGAAAVAYVIFGFANTLSLLFFSRFVQGLGGGTTGVAQAYVADTMPPPERAKALGWLSAATSFGVVIGPFLGSFTHRFGAAAPALIAAALVLLNVAFAWKWLPESRRRPAAAGPDRSGTRAAATTRRGWFTDAVAGIARPVRHVVENPSNPVSHLIWIYAIAMLAFNALPPVFALYLHDRYGITANQIGYFFVIFGLVGVVMRTAPVGWVNRWLGEVRTMRLGATLLTLGFILVPLAPTLAVFVLCQLLLPLGTALLFPANSALVSHRADPNELGLTLGVQQTFRGIAAVLGPIWSGVAYQELGPTVPFFISAGVVACVVLLAARVPVAEPTPAAAATA